MPRYPIATPALPDVLSVLAYDESMATHTATAGRVFLELPFPCESAARRALRRAALLLAARVLRTELGHRDVAGELEAYVEALRDYPVADDGEKTVVMQRIVPEPASEFDF